MKTVHFVSADPGIKIDVAVVQAHLLGCFNMQVDPVDALSGIGNKHE